MPPGSDPDGRAPGEAEGKTMDSVLRQRAVMAGLGLMAGASLYLLSEIFGRGILSGWPMARLAVFALVFFIGLLGMTGPLRPVRAALGAAAVALILTGFFAFSAWRFDTPEAFATAVPSVLAAAVLALLPLPFLIAAAGPGGWRDYPALFAEAWGLVLRYAVAWVFAGLVWLLLWLSDALLSVVGIDAIGQVLRLDATPALVTGLTLGLGLAVSQEFGRLISPWLPLRLLRLLVPALLAVMAVFVVALPLRGMEAGLPAGISATVTLICMVAVAAALITAAVDADDAAATQMSVLRRATQTLAAILPVPAVLAAWGLWLRVAEHGWTPDRLFLAVMAALALGYGWAYALAALRGACWMARIRRANIALALAVLAAAALWLSPLLNAQAISARSQLARFEAGRVSVADLDLAAFRGWGPAGRAALARLDRLAAAPGQEALAARLAGAAPAAAEDPAVLRAGLASVLPLQPEGARATRDMLLDGMTTAQIRDLTEGCAARLDDGRPACVMVVADLWPDAPGEEAIYASVRPGGALTIMGLARQDDGTIPRQVARTDGAPPAYGAAARALISAWQAAPPPLSSARLNQIAGPEGAGLILLP